MVRLHSLLARAHSTRSVSLVCGVRGSLNRLAAALAVLAVRCTACLLVFSVQCSVRHVCVCVCQEAGHELLRVESRKSQRAGVDLDVQLEVQLAPACVEHDAERLRAALEAALGAHAASASVPLPLPPSLSSPTRAIAADRKSGACD